MRVRTLPSRLGECPPATVKFFLASRNILIAAPKEHEFLVDIFNGTLTYVKYAHPEERWYTYIVT